MTSDKDTLKASLGEALKEILEQCASVNDADHSEHHAWIQAHIESEQNRKEMYQTITRTVLQWSIPFLFTGLIYWFQTGHWPHA